MSLSPKQSEVLALLADYGPRKRADLPPGHGTTQALNALVRKGLVAALVDNGGNGTVYRRIRRGR